MKNLRLLLQIAFRYSILFFLLVNTFNCATGAPYKMSELAPAFSKYEGTIIDPQTDSEKKIMKIESGIKKYADFFTQAKKIIIKVRIAVKAIKILKEQPDFIAKNPELFPMLYAELKPLGEDVIEAVKQGKELVGTVTTDFAGLDMLKAPGVISQLASTSKDLVDAGVDVKDVLVSLAGGKTDTAVADGTTIPPPISNVADETSIPPPKINKEENTKIKPQKTSEPPTVVINSMEMPADYEGKIKQLSEITTRNRKFAALLREKL